MLGYLSADIIREANSFPRAKREENCELRGTDNVQGQISEHIFAPNEGYCLYYPSNLFRNARNFRNWGIYICYLPGERSVWEKTVPEVLSTARGRRLRAVLKTKGTVFSHTDRPSPVNNIFIFFQQ